MAAVVALTAAALVVGCDSGGGPRSVSGSPGRSEMAAGSAQVFVADPIHRTVERRTDGEERHECPRWSPDGHRLAWRVIVGHDASEHARIELAEARGGAARRLEDNAVPAACPSWSPDGRRLAYVGMTGLGLQSITIDTGAPGRQVALGRHVALESELSWSRDGRSLAFSDQGELSVAIPSERIERRLTRSPDVNESAARYSPDGSAIAFLRSSRRNPRSPGAATLALIRPEIDEVRAVLRLAPGHGAVANWSPDGRWIAAEDPSSGAGVTLRLVTPTGRSGGRLEAAGSASWSRDGRLLAVPTGSSVQLFEAAKRTWRSLVLESPNHAIVQNAGISPDGRVVAYSDERGVKLVDTRTGARRPLLPIAQDEAVDDIRWSPDGRRVAIAIERESGSS